MKCKFCEGAGQIAVLEYGILDSESKFVRYFKETKTLLVDCPKCNGRGQAIK